MKDDASKKGIQEKTIPEFQQIITIKNSSNVSLTQVGGSINKAGTTGAADPVTIKQLEKSLAEAKNRLARLERKIKRKEGSREAGTRIETGDIRGSHVDIAGRDIIQGSSPLNPVYPEGIHRIFPSREKVDIKVGKVDESKLKIAGRGLIERMELVNESREVEAIEAEISGRQKGITYRDSWSSLKTDVPDDALIEEVEKILRTQALRMFYMPIVDFRQSPPHIVGYELLARGPKGSPLEKRPDKIFEVAGKRAKSLELDLLCVKKALEAGNKIPSGIKTFINILPLTLLDDRFYDLLNSCTKRDIVFEMIEEQIPHALFNEITDRTWRLKEMGYSIAADDQGAGGSNDQRLIEFKPHYIKIDQFFMRKTWTDQRMLAKECLSHYYNLSKTWNGQVIVESITEHHTQEDLNQLASLHIFLGQGYLFGEAKEGL